MGRHNPRPSNYWKSLENTVNEAKALMKKLRTDVCPSADVMKKHKISSLTKAIEEYHGGMDKFRRILGEKDNNKCPPTNQLREDSELMKKTLLKILDNLGTSELPGIKLLKEKGYERVVYASSSYGGINGLRELMGQEPSFRGHNYWNKKTLIEEANKIKKKYETSLLPGAQKLRKLGHGGFAASIEKIGMPKFRKMIGEKNDEEQWSEMEYIIEQAKKYMKENKTDNIPSTETLRKNGHVELARAVSRHGGIKKFREMVGCEKNVIADFGSWQDLEYTINQAVTALNELNVSYLPSAKVLAKNGYTALARAINDHGGFPVFREILNKKTGVLSEKEQLEQMLDGYSNG